MNERNAESEEVRGELDAINDKLHQALSLESNSFEELLVILREVNRMLDELVK